MDFKDMNEEELRGAVAEIRAECEDLAAINRGLCRESDDLKRRISSLEELKKLHAETLDEVRKSSVAQIARQYKVILESEAMLEAISVVIASSKEDDDKLETIQGLLNPT